MKWIPDKSGAFPKRLFFDSMTELDHECERLVEFFHFRQRAKKFAPPLDDDTLQVLIEHSADIDLFATLEFGVEGETEFRPDSKPIIRMSADIASDPNRRYRLRTGMAHEWFHAAYHRPAWEILWARQRSRGSSSTMVAKCRRETMIAAPDRDWLEFQAGYASCAILMPRSWLERDVGELLAGEDLEEAKFIATVAGRYDVSNDAARWRLRQLGVLRHLRETAPHGP